MLIDFVRDEDAAVLAGEFKSKTAVDIVDSDIAVFRDNCGGRSREGSQADGWKWAAGGAIVGQTERLQVVGDGEVVAKGEIAGSAAYLGERGETVDPGSEIGAVQVVDIGAGVTCHELAPVRNAAVIDGGPLDAGDKFGVSIEVYEDRNFDVAVRCELWHPEQRCGTCGVKYRPD